MEVVVGRVAGLDVHKASVTACVRVPADPGDRVEDVETFAATVPGLLVLADWLEAHAVTDVAMEATGVYWKPVWAILEDRFSCTLVNARHVKQVPGRKTDGTDAQWLCRLAEAGLLRGSLVPPKPIRASGTSPAIERLRSATANAKLGGCTSCWKTPASNSTALRLIS